MKRPKNILIVDDEPSLRDAMATSLRLAGHTAFAAAGAADAIRIASEREIDFVVTDLRLEGADGIETLARIRSLRPGVRSIVMTGFATIDSAIQAMRLGAEDYLTKPFRMDAIFGAIEKDPANGENTQAAFQARLPWRKQVSADFVSIDDLLFEIDAVLRGAGVGDETRRRALSVFAEALHNAMHHAFAQAKGWIEIEMREEARALLCLIQDTGRGFDAVTGVAQALMSMDPKTPGLRFLHENADDLRIRSTPGKGCTIEFRIEKRGVSRAKTLSLPPFPCGERWTESLRRIRDTQEDLLVDGSALLVIFPQASRDFEDAIAVARGRGRRIAVKNLRLTRYRPNREDSLVRQTLWA